jgi:hypothetical protein
MDTEHHERGLARIIYMQLLPPAGLPGRPAHEASSSPAEAEKEAKKLYKTIATRLGKLEALVIIGLKSIWNDLGFGTAKKLHYKAEKCDGYQVSLQDWVRALETLQYALSPVLDLVQYYALEQKEADAPVALASDDLQSLCMVTTVRPPQRMMSAAAHAWHAHALRGHGTRTRHCSQEQCAHRGGPDSWLPCSGLRTVQSRWCTCTCWETVRAQIRMDIKWSG